MTIEEVRQIPREEKVQWLVKDAVESIREMIYQDDYSYLYEIKMNGIKGYIELPDAAIDTMYLCLHGDME
jgi:hypothetical protein